MIIKHVIRVGLAVLSSVDITGAALDQQGGMDRGLANIFSDVKKKPTKATCKKQCHAEIKAYDACIKRITKLGEGDCEAWYFDLLHCVDYCVAPQSPQNDDLIV